MTRSTDRPASFPHSRAVLRKPDALATRHHCASGYTLPLALLAMLITLAMLRGFHDRALSLVQQWRIGREADAVEEAATLAAVTAPLSPGRCSTTTVRSARGSTERLLCYESLASLVSVPPVQLPAGRVDYGSIFEAALSCPSQLRAETRTTFESPTARRTCLVGASAAAPLVLLENISGADLTIEPTGQAPFSLVATPGFLDLRGALVVGGDTLVVSGGNISVPTIVARKPSVVTLLSARGTVTVQQVSSGVSLVLVGPKELRAPPGMPPATAPLASLPLPAFRPPALAAALTLDGSGK